MNGELYGTTFEGGLGEGTVFKAGTSGAEAVLYRFMGFPDGNGPTAGLIDLINVNGMLDGLTSDGGIGSDGSVYEISP